MRRQGRAPSPNFTPPLRGGSRQAEGEPVGSSEYCKLLI